MSKELVDSLVDGILQAAEFQKDKTIPGTFSEIVRAKSTRAAHLLYVDKEELAHEIADMVSRAFGYDFSGGEYDFNAQAAVDPSIEHYKFTNSDLAKVVTEVYNNIVNACRTVTSGKIIIEEKDIPNGKSFLFKGNANVFDFISTNIFSKAFGGGKLRDLLVRNLPNLEKQIPNSPIGPDKLAIGHGASSENDISNLENGLYILITNRLKVNHYQSGAEIAITPGDVSVDEDLQKFENEFRKLVSNPTGLRQVWNALVRSGAIKIVKTAGSGRGQTSVSEKELKSFVGSFLDIGLTFTREIYMGAEGRISASIEPKITQIGQLEEAAKNIVVSARPQSFGLNSALGAAITGVIGRLTSEKYNDILKVLGRWMAGEQVAGLPDSPLTQRGSSSFKELAAIQLYEILKTGKSTTKSTTTKVNKPARPSKLVVTPAKVKGWEAKDNLLGKQQTVPKLKSSQGKFVSIVNVINIINLQLAEKIRQNMGSPRLNYRTGRFAKSAKIESGTFDRDGTLRLNYTYMKYPYQTFEPGFAKGSSLRDPKLLIGKSVREIAQQLVTSKLRVVRV